MTAAVADLRVANKIFATLADPGDIFSPVPNAWGRQGATLVKLSAVKPDILAAALRTAWLRRAPKKLHT